MKKYELTKLKKQLMQEIQRRKRVNELLEEELIQEFIKLSDIEVQPLKDDDINGILFSILRNFTITETNGIYVCTGTFASDCDICYEETTWYSRLIDFDSKDAEYREYCDIEDSRLITAYTKQDNLSRYAHLLASEFEKNNIVLNPYNSGKNRNGYEEVREEFFVNAIEKGQGKAKKLILDKYPRI